MKKDDVWDEEINPDGISLPVKNLNHDVWDKGYFMSTDDGIWYELYVTAEVKSYNQSIDINDEDVSETFSGFDSLSLDNYADYNQITFFEPHGEEDYTLAELEAILE